MQPKRITIVIPTYNERHNIEPLVQQILVQKIPQLSIIIVDDNSPDGTGETADQLARQHPEISVIHRAHKEGLGPAYVAGFQRALEQSADLIFEMDADFSHDPSMLAPFITAAETNDLVLGSRYIQGGAIRNWSLLRRLVSYFGNVYARFVLQLPIRDLTGGYKCYRRTVLEKIDIHSLASVGYVFQIETTYKAVHAGFRITEIPITFTERREGNSKFSLSIFVSAFISVLMLRFKKTV